ncbi:MAG: hypothetical protein ACREBS_06795 [Nitrososphaerales archaeon]
MPELRAKISASFDEFVAWDADVAIISEVEVVVVVVSFIISDVDIVVVAFLSDCPYSPKPTAATTIRAAKEAPKIKLDTADLLLIM